MNILKDKTIVILFNNNSKEIEEIAIDMYKELKEKGLKFAKSFFKEESKGYKIINALEMALW